MSERRRSPYEEVDYPGYAYPLTHPAHLEVLGRLFGLDPAPAPTCRVLELGCGEGVNSLAIAHTLPRARVIAVDAAISGLDRGRALATAAGIDNAELLHADLADVDRIVALGPFDYVVAHGVYSWIPPLLRGALLECCRRALSPHGIAYVSYNAYPGSYLRDMARDVLVYHLQGVSEPTERLARAHVLMETIVASDSPTPYAAVLREHLQRMLASGEALLYHDDLAPVSTPFYFHEFIEHAAAHELQFLSEANLADSQLRDVPEGVGELMANLPRDVIVREQHLDFFLNRMFRQTLLVHEGAPVQRAIDDRHLEELAVCSPAQSDGSRFETPEGATLSTPDPLLIAAMQALCEAWPQSVLFHELVERTARRLGASALPESDRDRLRAAVLEVYLGRILLLHSCQFPVSSRPGERPGASPLARAQHAAGRRVLTTLLGENRVIEDPRDRALLARLDGTRDRAALADELEVEPEQVEQALVRLARHGLISA